MSKLTVQKIRELETGTVPTLDAIAGRFEEIQLRAYDLFEKRGCEPGHDLDDWFEAEREIMGSFEAEFVEPQAEAGLPEKFAVKAA